MFTFTYEQLRQLLSDTITDYAGKATMDFIELYRQDRDATVARIMAQLEASQPQRDTLLENSLTAIDEDEEYGLSMHGYGFNDIPFDGQPIPYESDDDSPAEVGLPPAA